MKQIVEEYNKSQQEVRVTQTTLTWGEPFYTKVHTAVVAGQTPDVMSYHLSHFPAGIAGKDLRPITPEELSGAGLKESDFQQSVVERSREASTKFGQTEQLFGVPLDIHTLVLYYNKTSFAESRGFGPGGQTDRAREPRCIQKDARPSEGKGSFNADCLLKRSGRTRPQPGARGTRSSNNRMGISSKTDNSPSRICQSRERHLCRPSWTWPKAD